MVVVAMMVVSCGVASGHEEALVFFGCATLSICLLLFLLLLLLLLQNGTGRNGTALPGQHGHLFVLTFIQLAQLARTMIY